MFNPRSPQSQHLLRSLLAVALLSAVVASACWAGPAGEAAQRAMQSGKYVLLDFWGGWCTACTELDKSLADPQVAQFLQTYFEYARLDVGDQTAPRYRDLQQKYMVREVPCLVILKTTWRSDNDWDGWVIASRTGYQSPEGLLRFLQNNRPVLAPGAGGGSVPPVPPDPSYPSGTGTGKLRGNYQDSNGAIWQFTPQRMTIIKGGSTIFQGDIVNCTTRSMIVANGNITYNITYSRTVNNGVTLSMTAPNYNSGPVNLMPTTPTGPSGVGGGTYGAGTGGGGVGGGPIGGGTLDTGGTPGGPNGGSLGGSWKYLRDAVVRASGWPNGFTINFEQQQYAESYAGYGSGAQGSWSLAEARTYGVPQYVVMTLGVSDETPPDQVFQFKITLDNRAPTEYKVSLGKAAHNLRIPVQNVGRLGIDAVRLVSGSRPGLGRPVIIQPKVYFSSM